MKTRNAVLTLAAVIVASAFTFAATPTFKVAVVTKKNSGVFKVIYEGETSGKVTLKITDNKSNVIFSQTNKSISRFIQPLNFAGMEQGEYNIEITDKTGTQIKKVNYAVAEAKRETAVKSYHITKLQEEGKYLISVVGQNNGKISVQIFDGNDDLIHSENLVVNGNIGLVYKLKSVNGQPSFIVK